MRARGVPSPDEWDTVVLTFAEPVSSTPSNFNRVIEYRRAQSPSARACQSRLNASLYLETLLPARTCRRDS